MPQQSGIQPLPDRCRLVQLQPRSDDRGSLVAIEAATGLPFEIQRVYYIFGTPPGAERGFHAHLDLVQWAICISGACTIAVDSGSGRTEVRLDSPEQALEIGPMVWREMRDFTPDAVLVVIASKPHDPDDYIRDHDEFLRLAHGG